MHELLLPESLARAEASERCRRYLATRVSRWRLAQPFQVLLQSINDRDIVVVEAVVLVFALIVVLANLLTDLLYAVLDPRIRYGRPAA